MGSFDYIDFKKRLVLNGIKIEELSTLNLDKTIFIQVEIEIIDQIGRKFTNVSEGSSYEEAYKDTYNIIKKNESLFNKIEKGI